MATIRERAISTHAALTRDPKEWWDDEHCLDNGQAALIIRGLLDENDRLQHMVTGLIEGPASEMSYAGRLVPVNSAGMREMIDENVRLREHGTCPDTELLNGLCSCWRHGPAAIGG